MSRVKSGKDGLLLWCGKAVSHQGLTVKNFTKDFKDGLVFCAICHRYAPDQVGDWDEVLARSVDERLRLAFSVAERCGVPSLLDAEDIIEMDVPDKLSIITYVSELYQMWGTGGASFRRERSAAALGLSSAVAAAAAAAPTPPSVADAPPNGTARSPVAPTKSRTIFMAIIGVLGLASILYFYTLKTN